MSNKGYGGKKGKKGFSKGYNSYGGGKGKGNGAAPMDVGNFQYSDFDQNYNYGSNELCNVEWYEPMWDYGCSYGGSICGLNHKSEDQEHLECEVCGGDDKEYIENDLNKEIPEEDDLVCLIIEEFPDLVKEYSASEDIDFEQAAAELIEGYVVR